MGPRIRCLPVCRRASAKSWLALVAGRSNSEIGAALFISDKTVRNSLTRIFEKLGVRTRMQAAVLARDHGFAPAAEM